MPEYQNPQQEPGQERRLLLVFVLTFLVLIAFQPLLKKWGPAPPPPAKQTALQQAASQQTSGAPAAPAQASTSAAVPAMPKAVVSKQASAETETVIENDLYRITFTNRGAQVKSWILKKFDNDAQNGPLELVNTAAAEKYGYPLSLWTYNQELSNRLSSLLYVPSEEGKQNAPASVTFEFTDQDLSVRKTFHFDHTYLLQLETSVTYKGAEVSALPMWPSGFGDQNNAASYASGRIDYHSNTSTDRTALVFPNYVLRLGIKNIVGGNTLAGPFEWADAADQYFTAVFVPDDGATASVVTLRRPLDNPQDAKHPFDVVGVAVGSLHGTNSERMYVGPKELAVLEKIPVPTIRGDNPDLRGVVDFGWWGLIARPLFLWLKWTYNHVVPNWGWAIVLQTLIITVALLPLRISQMKSMLKMQRIAPQVKSIQEKYKKYSLKDPRKAPMQEEIGALYKKEGVNPLGGCVPLLIQFPFLIAYYRMLGIALDLRHAHWLWIRDLSGPDHILAIGMILSMVLMQSITPQAAGMDPQQQRMMKWMMPLMMGFIFFNLAAGLNLYYAESNLISIAQQAIMNRTKLGREMREMVEKRARKKDK